MDPISIMVAATAVKAVGAMADAHAQAGALDAQAAGASYNAAVSRQQADQALQVSAAQQMQQRRAARQALGRQRAAGAQAGVGLGGTTADLLEQSETLAELDALNIAYEGSLRARGYATQAELDDFHARVYRGQAKTVRKSGTLRAFGAVLGGAADIGTFSGRGTPTRQTTVGGGGSGLRMGSGTGFRSYGGTGLRYG